MEDMVEGAATAPNRDKTVKITLSITRATADLLEEHRKISADQFLQPLNVSALCDFAIRRWIIEHQEGIR